MYDLCSEMKTYIGKELKIVSVAAGITLESLKDALSGGKVYRAMPNIGAKHNLGITSIFS